MDAGSLPENYDPKEDAQLNELLKLAEEQVARLLQDAKESSSLKTLADQLRIELNTKKEHFQTQLDVIRAQPANILGLMLSSYRNNYVRELTRIVEYAITREF